MARRSLTLRSPGSGISKLSRSPQASKTRCSAHCVFSESHRQSSIAVHTLRLASSIDTESREVITTWCAILSRYGLMPSPQDCTVSQWTSDGREIAAVTQGALTRSNASFVYALQSTRSPGAAGKVTRPRSIASTRALAWRESRKMTMSWQICSEQAGVGNTDAQSPTFPAGFK